MHATALEVTGGDRSRADRLVAMTTLVAEECTQEARSDLGIGAVHLPEAEVLGIAPGTDPMAVLAQRCRAAVDRRYPGAGEAERQVVLDRLDEELAVIDTLGYPTYFLTVAEVTDLIRERGVRVAARGSGAGSLVNHLLGISGVDPIRHRLLMERFCSPLRAELPDIDVDVESARRTEIYEAVLERFGGERVTCVSMMDTYKVRHAVRDVGAALGLPPVEVDEIAKAFPHIRARDARHAIADLPELRSRGLDSPRMAAFFDLVEALDGLPRHIALHPCGIVLSNSGLLDRTPVEASWLGFPMSQFDKDDVETLGFLKLDVLGIRMQSSMAHAVAEVERVSGEHIDLDDEAQVPHDDPATYELIRTTRTLGMFQIESPGQRELVGKLGPSPVRRPHRRHLAVPPRPGQVRHDHAVPQQPPRVERAPLPPPEPHPGARGDRGGRRLPRAGAAHRRRDHRGHPRPGRRGAPQHGHPAGPGRRRGVVAAGGERRGATPPRTATGSGRCSSRSRASASARRTRRPSPCRPSTRRG